MGKIKWFGGTNGSLDFGFVQVLKDDDLFVHASQCRCDKELLCEGTVVTFEKSFNPKKGKYQAKALRLLDEDHATSILERCIESNDATYLSLSRDYRIKLCVITAQHCRDDNRSLSTILEELVALILSGSARLNALIWPEIPDHILHDTIFIKAVAQCLGKIPLESPESSFCPSLDLAQATKNMPPSLKSDPAVFSALPAGEQVAIYWDSGDDLQTLWGHMPDNTRHAFASRAVAENKHLSAVRSLLDKVFFGKLAVSVQIGLIWDIHPDEISQWWLFLSEEAKVRALYRAVSQNTHQSIFANLPAEGIEHITVQFFLLASLQGKQKDVFLHAHERFQAHVIERAWATPKPLLFNGLLAACPQKNMSKVSYCEGRAWFTGEEKREGATRALRAFCPRTGKGCSFNVNGQSSTLNPLFLGARIYPDISLPWMSWSLSEMLESLGVTPNLPELKTSDDYLPSLCGWINRLNEIRDRLKCSVCQTVMKPNYTYAKNLARYNVTIVSCPKGFGHDTNIYINHCWGCNAVIDSRESRIRVENRYICIHCGSGPQRSESYSQGDICPSCGHREITSADQVSKCLSCGHSIRRLPAHKVTGSREEEMPKWVY